MKKTIKTLLISSLLLLIFGCSDKCKTCKFDCVALRATGMPDSIQYYTDTLCSVDFDSYSLYIDSVAKRQAGVYLPYENEFSSCDSDDSVTSKAWCVEK